jgi:hypothetical protein
MEDTRRLGERLKTLYADEQEAMKQRAIERHNDEMKRWEARADEILKDLPAKLEELARRGYRWGTIQRPVKTKAEHWPPRTTTNKNVCLPEDLLEESRVIYQRCVDDLGLTVEIRYWQEHDYDEPGAYIGGYEMVAVW